MSNSTPSTTSSSSTSASEENNINNNKEEENIRQGTITSARWNLLSSMVGGGTLSLPLAFRQMGTGFLGPLLLLLVALCVKFTITFLIKAGNATSSGNKRNNNNVKKRGNASLETVASQAFNGSSARVCTMLLVCTICFFATTGYAVLLRDLLEPLADHVLPPSSPDVEGPTLGRNLFMMCAVLLITPLTTLKTLTALKNVGAASMTSLLLLSIFIFTRSMQCNFSSSSSSTKHTSFGDYINYTPASPTDFFNALPIFISSFVCHFNVLSVHNELVNPTPTRVSKLVNTTIWPAALFYILVGFSGSMYGNCTADKIVQGNVLLDFEDDDVLMNIGRMCLVVTISLTFPMLVLPIRDLVLRNGDVLREKICFCRLNVFGGRRYHHHYGRSRTGYIDEKDKREKGNKNDENGGTLLEIENDLAEPLLPDNEEDEGLHHRSTSSRLGHETTDEEENSKLSKATHPLSLEEERHRQEQDDEQQVQQQQDSSSYTEPKTKTRIITAIVIFWSASIVACTVQSIDVVWDLLGSSLSIIIAFLIPCGSYLILVKPRVSKVDGDDEMQIVDESGGGEMIGVTDTSSMMEGNGVAGEDEERSVFQRCCSSCRHWNFKRGVAWIIIVVFIPLMFICTGNAIYTVVRK